MIDDNYIEFINLISKSIKGKEVHRRDSIIASLEMYDAHSYVCSTYDDFKIVLSYEGWVAFVFEDDVDIYRFTCHELIFSKIHNQIVQN